MQGKDIRAFCVSVAVYDELIMTVILDAPPIKNAYPRRATKYE